MLRPEALRDLLAGELKTRDRLLVVLAVDVLQPKSVSTIKAMSVEHGWRGAGKVNVSSALAGC